MYINLKISNFFNAIFFIWPLEWERLIYDNILNLGQIALACNTPLVSDLQKLNSFILTTIRFLFTGPPHFDNGPPLFSSGALSIMGADVLHWDIGSLIFLNNSPESYSTLITAINHPLTPGSFSKEVLIGLHNGAFHVSSSIPGDTESALLLIKQIEDCVFYLDSMTELAAHNNGLVVLLY